jgi:hypothetical protein
MLQALSDIDFKRSATYKIEIIRDKRATSQIYEDRVIK